MRRMDWKEEMAASASSGESLTVVVVAAAAMMVMVMVYLPTSARPPVEVAHRLMAGKSYPYTFGGKLREECCVTDTER